MSLTASHVDTADKTPFHPIDDRQRHCPPDTVKIDEQQRGHDRRGRRGVIFKR